jgi:hypothetical protein
LSERVESIQKRAADAPAEAVIHSLLSLTDVFIARQSHGWPPLISLSEDPRKVLRKNHKIVGVQVYKIVGVQVSQVSHRFPRFLSRFPRVSDGGAR